MARRLRALTPACKHCGSSRCQRQRCAPPRDTVADATV
jgi:hypothetical protein